ncbi:MAG: ATP-binding protein [Oceanococcaceae bacterium]
MIQRLRDKLRRAPLRPKLRLTVVGTALVTLLLVMAIYISYAWFAAATQMREDLSARAQIIAANSSAALVFQDAGAATETVSALSSTPDVIRACIYRRGVSGPTGLFAEYHRPGDTAACHPQPLPQPQSARAQVMQVIHPITLETDPIGEVLIDADLSKLWRQIEAVAWGGLLVTLLVSLLAVSFSRIVESTVAQPILALYELMQRVAATNDYSLRSAVIGPDEIGALAGGFNGMLERVAQRDDELREAKELLQRQVQERDHANAEMNQALEQLRNTQDQLVQSEKMASLGGLVAGVAHEINTPIGVAYTAASTLQSRSHELAAEYAEGALRRSALDRYVRQASEIGDMIVKNLGRAAELIQSFKQVAVDQTSGERRRFALKEYVEETLVSLRPRLKKLPYSVDFRCEEGLVLNGYPGAISQILTNLIMNSVIHGFEGRDHGRITIHAQHDGESVLLRYTDDGCGLSREARQRIFDPFYTTKRGQGGSGLGMHIVFNLVTRTLGGRITLPESEQGATFELRFPLDAPA